MKKAILIVSFGTTYPGTRQKNITAIREQHRWQEILGVSTIGELNKANDLGLTNQLLIFLTLGNLKKKIASSR